MSEPVAWMNPDGGFMSHKKRELWISKGDPKRLAEWHNTPLYAGEPEQEVRRPKIPPLSKYIQE